jgi:hypothetical protein
MTPNSVGGAEAESATADDTLRRPALAKGAYRPACRIRPSGSYTFRFIEHGANLVVPTSGSRSIEESK